MTDKSYAIDQFHKLVMPILGLPVSWTWKGFGSTVFFELGQITTTVWRRRRNPQGEACISVDWDWRVENKMSILFGSSDSGPTIADKIKSLRGQNIDSLAVEGSVPELRVGFSNGEVLRSMAMKAGNPEWSIKLSDENYLYALDGNLHVGLGDMSLSPEERTIADNADRAAKRWGKPGGSVGLGRCKACKWFVVLDGQFGLMDYGACHADNGPFDGQVVHAGSCCACFTSAE